MQPETNRDTRCRAKLVWAQEKSLNLRHKFLISKKRCCAPVVWKPNRHGETDFGSLCALKVCKNQKDIGFSIFCGTKSHENQEDVARVITISRSRTKKTLKQSSHSVVREPRSPSSQPAVREPRRPWNSHHNQSFENHEDFVRVVITISRSRRRDIVRDFTTTWMKIRTAPKIEEACRPWKKILHGSRSRT